MENLKFQIIIFLIIILSSLIICLIFSLLKLSKNSLNIIKSLNNDINNKLIYSISLKQENSACSKNESILIIDNFPGTITGCDCIGIRKSRVKSNHRDRINRGSCSYNESIAGCRIINSIESKDFIIWDNNTFCVNYSKYDYEYYLNLSVGEGENCPSGFKKCGILDSLFHVMCIEENLDCPINKILINNESYYSENNINFNTINLKNNKYLHYTNKNINDQVISNFKLNEEGFPCYNPMRYNTIYPQYILLENFESFICIDKFNNSFYDKRYQYLDSISKYKLYNENSLYDSLTGKPNYPSFSFNSQIGLYIKNYFGINKHCSISENSKISSNIENISHNHEIAKKINIVYFTINIILLILFPISYIIFFSNQKLKCFLIFNGINCFLLLGNFILGIYIFNYLDDINLSSNCYDAIMSNFIEKAKNNLHKEKKYVILIIIFNFSCIILNIAFILIQINISSYCEKNNNKNNIKENTEDIKNDINNNIINNLKDKNEQDKEKPKDNISNAQYISQEEVVYSNKNDNEDDKTNNDF